jgi:hypothetical protein
MLITLLLCGFAAGEVTPPVFHAANEELRLYLLEAADNHPELKARYLEWQAALKKAPQVTSLDDPMFV